MACAAASSAARCLKKCSRGLQNANRAWYLDTALLPILRLTTGMMSTHATSGGPCTAGSMPTEPVVRGVGLKQRLKDTPSADLRNLLKNTADYDHQTSQTQVRKPEQPDVLPQWNRLDLSINAAYTAKDFVLKDVFAVIEAGPTQFKVVADDRIFIHKMEGVDVDDIVQFNRVLLAGTPNDTLVGRPFVQSVHVIAAVEEQVKVPCWRHACHHVCAVTAALLVQELTALRILKIFGIEQYGVDLPDWQEHASTHLKEMDSFASQVRARRRRTRAAQRRRDTDAVLAHLESGQEYGGTSYPDPISMPYKPLSSS